MTISAPSLSKLCGIALYSDNVDKTIDVRNRQTFLHSVRTNIKSYNPTAPTEVLPALADISAYLYNDQDTDPLIKTALVHYQFEIIHPFEQYNGIVGRITIPLILHDITCTDTRKNVGRGQILQISFSQGRKCRFGQHTEYSARDYRQRLRKCKNSNISRDG